MVNWDEVKGKLEDIGEAAKKTFSVAADRTQKGARIASLKVKIVMEENKTTKAMGELGKKVYELTERSEANIADNSQVKEIIKIIKISKQAAEDIKKQINLV
ncbi:MAG: hypothetical protein ABH860_04505 [bacterium]